MNTVKVGGRNYDSTQLMNAVNNATLAKTSKGGLVVELKFTSNGGEETISKLTRNQLVKLVTAFEKKDTSRPLSKRIQDLTKLEGILEHLNSKELELYSEMDPSEKKKLASRQKWGNRLFKWGNRFFKRDEVLKKAQEQLGSKLEVSKDNFSKALFKALNRALNEELKKVNKEGRGLSLHRLDQLMNFALIDVTKTKLAKDLSVDERQNLFKDFQDLIKKDVSDSKDEGSVRESSSTSRSKSKTLDLDESSSSEGTTFEGF